ncbi:MAG: AAA family ATPase, partial [Candidatus Eremiobacterota bacterium]
MFIKEREALADRYRLDRILRQGQGITTWSGTDLAESRQVIVKTAVPPVASGGALLRLQHEARILSELDCPWVVSLVDCGRQGDCLFLVMPRVPGTPLSERLAGGALDLAEVLTLGRCLFTALDRVHARGVLHRDVKPSNLIVDGPPVREAVLVDFGLSRSNWLNEGIPAGTLRYMAPEAAGLLVRADVGPASDLYSAGVVLYEALAGHPPFRQDAAGELLRAHLSEPPPPLPSAGPMQDLLDRLLRKDPRDRYQSAGAVVYDLEQAAACLAGGGRPVVGLRDHRASLAEPAFVGREAELSALTEAVSQAARGRGSVILVEGASGSGKSRLLEQLARGSHSRALVLQTRARNQTAPRPLAALDEVLRTLVLTHPELRQPLAARLEGWEQALGAALPQLGTWLGASEALPAPPEQHGEERTLKALAAFLQALGEPGRPALVTLDDAQWADELTSRLLASCEARHLLVVASVRPEELPSGHPLARLDCRRLSLARLTDAETEALARSVAGDLPPESLALVRKLSGGNPFLAVEGLAGMVESGVLQPGQAGWVLQDLEMDRLRASDRAVASLLKRVDSLPEEVARALSVGAVLGREFDLDELAALIPGPVLEPLAEARRRALLWEDLGGTRFTFVHDRLREDFLRRLPPPVQRELHLGAARFLEEHHPDRVHA